MRIFVVLATREREELLARTLTSLAQCRRPAGFAGTYVVENGTRGDTERVVREAAAPLEARYLFEPAGNKSRALNAALAQIDDGLVIFLDDDVRLTPEVLELYATAARAGPGCFFGGPVEPDYEAAPPEWLTAFLPPSARQLVSRRGAADDQTFLSRLQLGRVCRRSPARGRLRRAPRARHRRRHRR